MLDEACENFLDERRIDTEVAVKYGIYTANNVVGTKRGSSVLVFPYLERGETVNEKFRLLPKQRFWQHSGRRKIFWNADALDDPALEAGTLPLIITEGEFDALAAIQCGFPLAVSVPDGAPPTHSGGAANEEYGASEQTGRFEFLWSAREKIKKAKRFIIATDDDGPGQRLREELIRRLSPGRCSFVEYPEGCKDLNDVLLDHGPSGVAQVLNRAKQWPVKGLYRLSDYPEEAELATFSSGFPLLDNHFRLVLGEFIVVTGIPQHGKSSICLQLLANLASLHGFRSAIFSPEMRVVPVIRDRMLSIRTKRIARFAEPQDKAWIEDNFVFIGTSPVRNGDDDDDFTLEWIIDKAIEAVLRDGIRILLIDPWNEVEHAKGKGESMTEYVARGIRMLKRFSQHYNVAVIVVAHPTKMPKEADGEFEVPTLYDISDSAAWFNKCDHGIVVHRTLERGTEVRVVKSRFDEAGEPGMVRMKFDQLTHRFEALTPIW